MPTFRELLEKETQCITHTRLAPGLRATCRAIEQGITLIQTTTERLSELAPREEVSASTLLLAWISQQVNGAYSLTLRGNYSAAIETSRAALEGIIFMKKYAGNKTAAAKWLNDPNYEDEKVHAILSKDFKQDKRLAELYNHYRELSRLAHPHAKSRKLFTTQTSPSTTLISTGGTFNKMWSKVLLAETLFLTVHALGTVKPLLGVTQLQNEIEEFQASYKHVMQTELKLKLGEYET